MFEAGSRGTGILALGDRILQFKGTLRPSGTPGTLCTVLRRLLLSAVGPGCILHQFCFVNTGGCTYVASVIGPYRHLLPGALHPFCLVQTVPCSSHFGMQSMTVIQSANNSAPNYSSRFTQMPGAVPPSRSRHIQALPLLPIQMRCARADPPWDSEPLSMCNHLQVLSTFLVADVASADLYAFCPGGNGVPGDVLEQLRQLLWGRSAGGTAGPGSLLRLLEPCFHRKADLDLPHLRGGSNGG